MNNKQVGKWIKVNITEDPYLHEYIKEDWEVYGDYGSLATKPIAELMKNAIDLQINGGEQRIYVKTKQ